MALYKVDSDTADLTKVAGGTLYADLPIGSWIKNDMATIPSGFLKVGDTISQSECPELYAKYGSTVPYRADKSELDSYSTNVSYSMLTSGYTMLYDGFIEIRMQGSSGQASPVSTLTVNNSTTMQCGNYNDGARRTQSFFFRKGDVLKVANANSSSFECKIAYYKKSLIVKAKQVSVPFDIAEYIRNQNILSDWENITLPTTAATAITMQYDGFIYIDAHAEGEGVGAWVNLYVNGKLFRNRADTGAYNINTPSLTVPVKKGDVVYLDNSPKVVNKRATFYKLRDYTGR